MAINSELSSSRDNPIDLTVERFILFPKLSPELRVMIWAIAANEPETVFIAPVICNDNRAFMYRAHRKFPPILHVSVEAQTEGLKHFSLEFARARHFDAEEEDTDGLSNPAFRPSAYNYTPYGTYINWNSNLIMPVKDVIWPVGGWATAVLAKHWRESYQPRRLALDVWFEDVVDVIDLLRKGKGHFSRVEEITLYADEKRTAVEKIYSASMQLVKEESLSKARMSVGARLAKAKKRVEEAFEKSSKKPVVKIGEVQFGLEELGEE